MQRVLRSVIIYPIKKGLKDLNRYVLKEDKQMANSNIKYGLHILWIHWRVYNSTANISKQVLFRPPSDAYVRSFLYLLYTLIKLYYTQTHTHKTWSSSLVIRELHIKTQEGTI